MVAAMGEQHRLTIRPAPPDRRSARLAETARQLGIDGIDAVHVADVVFVDGSLGPGQLDRLHSVLVDPELESGSWAVPVPAGRLVEVALHPGVTDADAAAVDEAATLLGVPVRHVATGRSYEIEGSVDDAGLERLVRRLLANPVIERWTVDSPIEPHHAPELAPTPAVQRYATDASAMAAANVERSMYLDQAELEAIGEHFAREGRPATDVELEALAQTWSEHCAHKSFRAAITTTDGAEHEPLLRRLRETTELLAAPFVVSAFDGNAGVVQFEPGRTIALKCETHNHPSAVEPFGGANTGVGGVIRDVLGAAHRPIACTDILCFGPADTPPDSLPEGVLHPLRIREGVVDGVADYGNKIGLPTVAGAVWYDPAYTANPLVFCGCIGEAGDDEPALTGPHPGDHVVVLGGRTGRDGIRGATFSSATMDATTGEVAGASVQIGDPITEKLLIDVLAGARHLYSAITDCGAGGLSSAVGEMAEGVGAEVHLDVVPLKYPGLAPWEIWLSEAQERMVLAVPPDRLAMLNERCAAHGVELTELGRFTGDGRLVVRHQGEVVLDLDTKFLHDGRPQRSLTAEMPRPHRVEPEGAGDRRRQAVPDADGAADVLVALLAHPNIASKGAIVHRYDHEILGRTVVRPWCGPGFDGPSDAVVLADPELGHGLAVGVGVNPWFGELDAQHMAWAVVDEAIRNVVAVGADPDRVALLDNFSWGDPRRPATFGQLVAAVEGCCAAALTYRAPFVSGKDSLNNEYVGTDGERHAVPPTLVVTAVAHLPDAAGTVSTALVAPGNLVVLLGSTRAELGGSHLDRVLGIHDSLEPAACVVPAPDPGAPARYRALHHAMRDGLVAACHDVSEGGLAVALAEMALGGRLGLDVTATPHPDPLVAWFAESSGRLVCEVAPEHLARFTATVGEPVLVLGSVTAEQVVALRGVRPLALDVIAGAFGATEPEVIG